MYGGNHLSIIYLRLLKTVTAYTTIIHTRRQLVLTLIERVRLHLNQPYTMGWDWTAENLIEELTAKYQRTDLPPRLRVVYTSLKHDLWERCQIDAVI